MKRICFNEYCFDDCVNFDNYVKRNVHKDSMTGLFAFNLSYVIDALESKNRNIDKAIKDILKNKENRYYCYSDYIANIYSDIYKLLPDAVMRMDICMESVIYYILIKLFGDKNNPDNELYKLYLKMNNQKIDLDLEKMYSKYANNTTFKTLVNSRNGQNSLRKIVLENNKKCKICGLDKLDLLKVSHIKPWAKSNDNEKLDIYNTFLLCPNHDNLFDKGYISFEDDGSILISPLLSKKTQLTLNIDTNISVDIDEEHKKYLKWHRDNILKMI